MKKRGLNKFNVASFFSGCGGLDYGFHNKKFKILLANDSWKDATKSFKRNYPEVPIINKPIEKISKKDIKKILGSEKIDILIGGPPCQCFTRLNNNHLIKLFEQKKEDYRRLLYQEYIKKVKILKPKIVLMENVRDILVRKNREGKLYIEIIEKDFRKIGYKVYFKLVSMNKYGIPQKRKRVIFIATNIKELIKKLDKNLDYIFPNESNKEFTVGESLLKIKDDEDIENHKFVENDEITLERIKNIPQGGYYEQLPDRLKIRKIRNGKEVIVKRYGSYFRRLNPNKASITVTKNYIIHPFKNRYLSNREKAILHTFTKKYKFCGSGESVSQQIANAVPPKFSIKIAQQIFKTLNTYT
jgi:DNA (cytosine-5)-methyltransferase 1